MDAMKAFFRKYSAVPANDRGVCWSETTDAQLLDWYRDYASVVECGWNRSANRDATPEERRAMRPLYEEICAHVTTRAGRPDATPEIMAAYFRLNHHRQPAPCEHDWHRYGTVNGRTEYGCQTCGATRYDD